MINPVNLYGVVFSSLVASGFWTNFQCFNENVDCRISFYSNRFWNSWVLCVGACVSVILSLRRTNPRPGSVPTSATERVICLGNTMWPCARTLGQDQNDFKMFNFLISCFKIIKNHFSPSQLSPHNLQRLRRSSWSSVSCPWLAVDILWHLFDPMKQDSSVFLPWSNVRRGQHAGARPVIKSKGTDQISTIT